VLHRPAIPSIEYEACVLSESFVGDPFKPVSLTSYYAKVLLYLFRSLSTFSLQMLTEMTRVWTTGEKMRLADVELYITGAKHSYTV